MKFFKIAFLIFLFIIVCFSLYHIETKNNVSGNSYFFAIIAVIVFVLCFLLLALKIKVGGQYIQLEQDLANLQVEQKKLSNISTTLYNLLIFLRYTGTFPIEELKNHEIFNRLQAEIEKYIDRDSTNNLMQELNDSHVRHINK